MTTTASHNRVGARSQAKLRNWSGKMTRRSGTAAVESAPAKKRRVRTIALSLKGKVSRKRTFEAAKRKLRRLFH